MIMLSGIMTDKDLAFRVVAEGLDIRSTLIAQVMTKVGLTGRQGYVFMLMIGTFDRNVNFFLFFFHEPHKEPILRDNRYECD